MTHEPPASRAERHPRRHLALPSHGLTEQQVRNVGAGDHQRLCDVIAIADVSQLQAIRLAEVFGNRENIGHRLTGVVVVGQAIDHGHGCVLGERRHRLVVERPDLHGVHHAVRLVQLGKPGRREVVLHHAEDLTVLHVVWAPGMQLWPHDHRMWAVIGVYGGREDNVFYRRSEDGLKRHGTKVLEGRDSIALGETIIHSVANPLEQITAAIHVYPGDFFDTPRSEWDPETFEEHPYDVEHTLKVFEESNKKGSERSSAPGTSPALC